MTTIDDFLYGIDFRLVGFIAFLALCASAEVGIRIGLKGKDASSSLRSLMGGVGTALLSVLGLLLGFMMSMAVSRWDDRHALVIDEANAIGTLWLRVGLLDAPTRDDIRSNLEIYTRKQIDMAEGEGSPDRLNAIRQEGNVILSNLWSTVEKTAPTVTSPAVLSSLISATNDVIDLSEKRVSSFENRLPPSVIFLLVFIGCIAMGFIGWSFGAAHQSRRHASVILAFALSIVLGFLMDLNHPQRGHFVVGVKPYERLLKSMEPTG